MRYIGSKVLLLDKINNIISQNIDQHNSSTFCDMFSGTGVVSNFFKNQYNIISNDLLFFSFVLQRAYLCNGIVNLEKLTKYLKLDPINYLNSFSLDNYEFKFDTFIYNNYCPNSLSERQYLSESNAKRIDFIRQSINFWLETALINLDEYYYLLATLINSVPYISNIAGTYGAYLKHWDKRALKNITLKHINSSLYTNDKLQHMSFNMNANELIKNIRGDILYLDPPYNSRQYATNYHLLETIARYDYPKIKGKTGIREYEDIKSLYCYKKNALIELDNLIDNANFKYVVLSYSNEGIISFDNIISTLKKFSINNEVVIEKIEYRRYQNNKAVTHKPLSTRKPLHEYLFFIQKRL